MQGGISLLVRCKYISYLLSAQQFTIKFESFSVILINLKKLTLNWQRRKKMDWKFLMQKNHRGQLVRIPVLMQVKRVLPGKTFWILAVPTSAYVTVAPTLNSLLTHLISQVTIMMSSNRLGI